MIVEDEWLAAMGMQASLMSFGYRDCGMAASGREAIRLAEEHRPDVILMDVNLADEVDGVTAAREILRRCPSRIIFVTAYSNPAVIERIEALGPAGLLFKPVPPQTLRAEIERALRRPS